MDPRPVNCPHCQIRVRADRLVRHLKRAHNIQSYTECPHCQSQVLTELYSQHIRAYHRLSPRLTKCPNCNMQVHAERLAEHQCGMPTYEATVFMGNLDNQVQHLPTPELGPEEIVKKEEHEQMKRESRRIIPVESTRGYESIPLVDLD